MRLPRPHLRFTSVCSLSRQLGVGEATANRLQHRQREAVFIGERVIFRCAIVEAEHLLTQVAIKMEGFDGNIGSAKTTLQQTPEILNSLRVYVAVHILVRVIDDLVNKVPAQAVILHCLIGVDLSHRRHVVEDRVLQSLALDVRHDPSANLPKLTVQHAVYWSLPNVSTFEVVALLDHRLAALVHLGGVWTDVNLIGLYGTAKAKLVRRVRLHRLTNPVEHKPCRFLGDSNRTVQFVGANAVLAVADHPDRRHPLVQTDRGVLKDRSDLDGELFLAALTEPNLASAHKRIGVRLTARARNFVIRPAHPLGILERSVRVTEVNNCLLESYGLFHIWHLRPVSRLLLTVLCVKYIIAVIKITHVIDTIELLPLFFNAVYRLRNLRRELRSTDTTRVLSLLIEVWLNW